MLATPPRGVKFLSNLTSESRFCSIICSWYELLWIKPNYDFGTDAAFVIPKYFFYFNRRPWKLGTPLQGVTQFHSQTLEDLQVERQSGAISVNLSMSIKGYLLLFSCFWDLGIEKMVLKQMKTVNGFIQMRWIPFVSSQDWVSGVTKALCESVWIMYTQCPHPSMSLDDLHESQGFETVLGIRH